MVLRRLPDRSPGLSDDHTGQLAFDELRSEVQPQADAIPSEKLRMNCGMAGCERVLRVAASRPNASICVASGTAALQLFERDRPTGLVQSTINSAVRSLRKHALYCESAGRDCHPAPGASISFNGFRARDTSAVMICVARG